MRPCRLGGSRSYSGQSSTSASTGMSPTSSPPANTRRRRVVDDLADRAWRAPPSARTPPRARASFSGSTTQSIRSWDSEIMISKGSMSSSRSGTCATSMSRPTSPFDAISAELEESPAAPRSWSDTQQCRRRAARGSTRAASSPRTDRRSAPSAAWRRRPRPELGAGQHGRSPDPVTPGSGAHQHQQVAPPAAALRISRSRRRDARRTSRSPGSSARRAASKRPHRRRWARRSSCRSGRCPPPRRRSR